MQPNNILILTSWSFKDALIQTYTLPYVRIIRRYLSPDSHIYLQTLEQPKFAMSPGEKKIAIDQLEKEHIHLIQVKYDRFGLKAMIKWVGYLAKLLVVCRTKRISKIHSWCTPAGTIGVVISKLMGIPLILDSYEPHAEAMVDSKTWKKGNIPYRILFYFEKMQSNHAKTVVAVSEGMRKYGLEKYGATFQEFYVKPACVDFEHFSKERRKNEKLVKELLLDEKLVCVYAGKFGDIYLEQEVFDFFKVAVDHWGDRFRILLLTSHSQQEIEDYAKASDLDMRYIVKKFVPHSVIPDYLGLADFAITPIKPMLSKQLSAPIKDGEYWAMGLPVIITPNISDDSRIIEENGIGSVIKELNKESYAVSVGEIDNLLTQYSKDELYDKIRSIAEKYRNYSIADDIYKQIYS